MSGFDWEAFFTGYATPAQQEASGQQREFAATVRDTYLAFESVGFTPQQALTLTRAWMVAGINATLGNATDEEN